MAFVPPNKDPNTWGADNICDYYGFDKNSPEYAIIQPSEKLLEENAGNVLDKMKSFLRRYTHLEDQRKEILLQVKELKKEFQTQDVDVEMTLNAFKRIVQRKRKNKNKLTTEDVFFGYLNNMPEIQELAEIFVAKKNEVYVPAPTMSGGAPYDMRKIDNPNLRVHTQEDFEKQGKEADEFIKKYREKIKAGNTPSQAEIKLDKLRQEQELLNQQNNSTFTNLEIDSQNPDGTYNVKSSVKKFEDNPNDPNVLESKEILDNLNTTDSKPDRNQVIDREPVDLVSNPGQVDETGFWGAMDDVKNSNILENTEKLENSNTLENTENTEKSNTLENSENTETSETSKNSLKSETSNNIDDLLRQVLNIDDNKENP